MKAITFLFLMVSQILFSQIWTETLDEAKKLAKEKNKLILIDFNASWCAPCRKMESDFWYNSKFTKTLDKFIVVPVDIDFNKSIASYYNINSIPNVKVVDYSGNVIHEFLGFDNAEKTAKEVEGFPDSTEDLYQKMEFKDKKNPTDEELLMLAMSYQILLQKSEGYAKSIFERMSTINFNKCVKKTENKSYKETAELSVLFNNVLINRNNKVIKSLDTNAISSENKSFAHYILAKAYYQENKKEEANKSIAEIILINDKQWVGAAEVLKKKYNE